MILTSEVLQKVSEDRDTIQMGPKEVSGSADTIRHKITHTHKEEAAAAAN